MYIKVVLSILSFINIHISFFFLLNELITYHLYFFDYSDLDLSCVWLIRMNFKNYAQIICYLKLLTIYHDNL